MNKNKSRPFQSVESLLSVLDETISNDDSVLPKIEKWLKNKKRLNKDVKEIMDIVKEHGFCVSLKYNQPILGLDLMTLSINVRLSSHDRRDFSCPRFDQISEDQPKWVQLLLPQLSDNECTQVHGQIQLRNCEDNEKINIEYGDWGDPVYWDTSYDCYFYFPVIRCLCKFYTTPDIESLNSEGNIEEWTLYPKANVSEINDNENTMNENTMNENQCHQKCNPNEDEIIKYLTGEKFTVEEWFTDPTFIIENSNEDSD